MRVGDIVRTPPNEADDEMPAIVLKKEEGAVLVSTGQVELLYDEKDLTPLATIQIMPHGYTNTSGNRFRVCYLRLPIEAQEHHVQVGAKGETAETRALEIRKLLFTRLVAEKIL